MRDIASELGMAVGNLYYYFASKDELLAYCHEDGLAGLLELAERVAALDLPAEQRLYLLVVGHVRQVNDAIPGALAHLALDLGRGPDQLTTTSAEAGETAGSSTASDALVAGRRAYEQAVRQVIREGVAVGRLRHVDPKLATLAVLGAVNWTARWYRTNGELSSDEIGSAFADILVRGLMAADLELVAPKLSWLDAPGPARHPTRIRR